MTVLNLKRKQVVSNYFIVFSGISIIKFKTDKGGGKGERKTEENFDLIP